jgi:hypothetical protein
MDIKEEMKFTNIDLENIYLKENSIEYIDSIIYWLNERKELGYTRIKPTKDGNVITLITII